MIIVPIPNCYGRYFMEQKKKNRKYEENRKQIEENLEKTKKKY